MAALIPAVLMTVVFAVMKFAPFGDSSILITDMSQQYIDYFAGYRDVLTEGKSMFYTWNTGMGMNFLGLFGYYLSSPFSLIVLLFPKSMIVEAVTAMSIAKTAACGITFYYMLAYMRKRHCAEDIVLSTMYALCSYNVAYFFNIMWIDGVIMLPLILIGVEKLLEERKIAFFTITLCVLFVSNFYISFMTGAFVFMWFVFRLICRNGGNVLKHCVRFAVGVLLAAAVSAVLLIPVYFSLKSAYGEMSSFSLGAFSVQTSLSVFIERMLFASPDTFQNSGTANVYCGVLALVMLPMYFFNSKIPRREKIVSAVYMLIFFTSLTNFGVAVIWHAFRAPTWFNYRFSFVFCCFLLLLGQRVLMNLDGLRVRYIGVSCGIILIAAVVCVKFFGEGMYVARALKENVVLIMFYCAVILVLKLGIKPVVRHTATAVLIAAVSFEVCVNGAVLLKWDDKNMDDFDSAESYRSAAELNEKMKETEESLETDGTFYRMENQCMRWSNDNIANGYNGIAHYSSLSNRPAFAFLNDLGMLCCTDDRYLRYFGSTNLLDDIFGIKYVADRTGEKHGYTEVAQYDNNVSLFKNENALPLAFGASDSVFDLSIAEDGNPFLNQNMFLSAIMGQEVSPFETVENFEFIPEDIETDENGNCTVTGGNPQFIIRFTAHQPRNYYLHVDSNYNEHNPIYVNGVRLGRPEDDYLRATIPLGYFEAGEEAEVRIKIIYNQPSAVLDNVFIAGLNNDVVDYCSAMLNSTSAGFKADGSRVEGTVTVYADNSAVFTTIPYCNGWTAEVDGQKTEIKAVNNAFIAIPVEAGTHDIKLTFCPKGFKPGLALTIVGILAAVVIFIYNDNRELYEKITKSIKRHCSFDWKH